MFKDGFCYIVCHLSSVINNLSIAVHNSEPELSSCNSVLLRVGTISTRKGVTMRLLFFQLPIIVEITSLEGDAYCINLNEH